jgi:hypothetical protein
MNGILVAGRTFGLLLGVSFGSPRITLAFYVIASGCCLIGSTIWKLRVSQVSIIWAFKMTACYIGISCGLLVPVTILTLYFHNVSVVLGFLGIATLLYGIILLKIDSQFRLFIISISGRYLKP